MARLFLLLLLAGLACARAALPAGTRYVMSHFKNDGGGGDTRLYISLSTDGLQWTAINGGLPVWQPQNWHGFNNVVRDPAIIYHNGFYWVAYTSGNYGHRDSSTTVTASFGLVKSADLLAWEHVGEISTVTPGATDPLTWSPTFFRDGDGSVHLYVSIRPHGGAALDPMPGMRTHELHPLNADWTQWSVPVLVDLPSTNTNEFWAWKEGDVYHGVFVDFTRGGSPYVHVTSAGPVAGWSNPLPIGFNGMEGAFLLKRPEGGYRWYLEQGNAGGSTTYLTADCSATFTSFTPLTPVQSTIGMRNGKAIAAPDGTSYSAWRDDRLAGVPADRRAPNADADRDGRSNAIEFATGGDPLHWQSGAPLALEFPGPRLRYRRANGAETDRRIEVSPDLVNWVTGAAITAEASVTLLTDGTEEVIARDISNLPGSRRFYRLSASFTAPAPENAAVSESAPSSPRVRAALRVPRAPLLRRPEMREQLRQFHQPFLPGRQSLDFQPRPFVAE